MLDHCKQDLSLGGAASVLLTKRRRVDEAAVRSTRVWRAVFAVREEEDSLEAREVAVVVKLLIHGPTSLLPAEHVKLSRVGVGSGINARGTRRKDKGKFNGRPATALSFELGPRVVVEVVIVR